MSAKERLSVSARKQQICEAAKQVFLTKGFAATTMEDIVKACGLSKGGLYYHYSSTADILYDLMLMGNTYRYVLIKEFMEQHETLSHEQMIAELVTLKMLDSNEYKSLYVMFLLEVKKNEKLKQLYAKMLQESLNNFLQFIAEHQLDDLACLANEDFISFTNAIIVATELLEVRDVFWDHKDFFKDIVELYMQKHKGISKN
ncbi:MAG: TetR/AcrR family transcriptional regulator [Treponema sp.]